MSIKSKFIDELNSITGKDNTNSIVAFIDALIKPHQLDEDKLYGELLNAKKRTTSINSVYSFFTKVAYRLAIEGKCKRELKIENFDNLIKMLKELGFAGEKWEIEYIRLIEMHIYTEFPVTMKEIENTNISIVEYCKSKGIKRYKEFADLVLKSKPAKKASVPADELEQRAKKAIPTFNVVPLFVKLDEEGIELDQEDQVYMEAFMTYIVSNELIEIDELRTLIDKTIAYVKEHNHYDGKSFLRVIKKSNALKDKTINYDIIDDVYKTNMKEWNRLIAELSYTPEAEVKMFWEEE